MNLLTDPWMPVRDAQGRREWIGPERLAEPQWRAFDANRPDFNGALAQFAIGLLQTTTPVADVIEWRRLFRQPPDATTLRQWFEPVRTAFELDGDGPRFMQDRYLHPWDGKLKPRHEDAGDYEPIQQLLIDCAGEGEKAKDNTDHFIKRKPEAYGLCRRCASAALFTLQCNAPGGGRGYLVSVRGGGPLSTLVCGDAGTALWGHLWLNVQERTRFDARDDRDRVSDLQLTFPWMGDLRRLQPGGISTLQFEGPRGGPRPSDEERPALQPSQVASAHVFWGMPRRVLLDFASASQGMCSICGSAGDDLVRRYLTKNYGLNYKGEWNHPLSPYRHDAKAGWLPLHPQPDGLGYRHWLAWVLGVSGERRTTRVAPVVTRALQHLRGQTGPGLRLWAFGYDMDNMKARCWYESTLPLYGLAECEPDAVAAVQTEVGGWLTGAELAAQHLRDAIKEAWFGHQARGNLAHVDATFWSATETPFYRQLQALVEAARAGTERDPLPDREAWHRTLTGTALRLFDEVYVGAGPVERQNPRRVAQAQRRLASSLHGSRLKAALGLPVPQAADKPRRGRSTKAAETAPKEPE